MGHVNADWQIWEWISIPEGWTISIPVCEAVWFLHNPIANGQNSLWITYHLDYLTLEIYLFPGYQSNTGEYGMSHASQFPYATRQEQSPQINARELEIIFQYPSSQNIVINQNSMNNSTRYNANRSQVDYFLNLGEIFYQRIQITNAIHLNNYNHNETGNGEHVRQYSIQDHILHYYDFYNFWQENEMTAFSFPLQIIGGHGRQNSNPMSSSARVFGNEQPLDLSMHPTGQQNNRRNATLRHSNYFQSQEEAIQQNPDNDENTTTLP